MIFFFLKQQNLLKPTLLARRKEADKTNTKMPHIGVTSTTQEKHPKPPNKLPDYIENKQEL